MRTATAPRWPLPMADVITDMIAVTSTRLPGDALSTRWRSTVIMIERGISPVGTASGASCSFHVCWSTYLHFSGSMVYGSTPHGASFGWRGRSHTRGSDAPPKPARTCTCLTVWHDLHWAYTTVALALTREVEMTMPGMVTRLETWLESSLRMLIGCFDEISVICSPTSRSSVSSTIELLTAASRAAFSKTGRWMPGLTSSSFVSSSSNSIRWSTSTSITGRRITIAERSASR